MARVNAVFAYLEIFLLFTLLLRARSHTELLKLAWRKCLHDAEVDRVPIYRMRRHCGGQAMPCRRK